MPEKIEWLLDLNDRLDDLLLAVDSELGVDLLQEAASRRGGKPMRVLVDLGTGKNRTGAPTVERAAALGGKISEQSSLRVAGLQCYAGYIQHIAECEARESEAMRAMERIAAARDALTEVVGPLEIVTGGGTGTFDIDPEAACSRTSRLAHMSSWTSSTTP